jgi:hypothetical protein
MIKKSERTVEAYKTAGAYIRMYRQVYSLGFKYLQPVMPKTLWDKWHRIDYHLSGIQDMLERRLFSEHQNDELPGENYIRVFYGDFSPRDEFEAEIIQQALGIIENELVPLLNKPKDVEE